MHVASKYVLGVREVIKYSMRDLHDIYIKCPSIPKIAHGATLAPFRLYLELEL